MADAPSSRKRDRDRGRDTQPASFDTSESQSLAQYRYNRVQMKRRTFRRGGRARTTRRRTGGVRRGVKRARVTRTGVTATRPAIVVARTGQGYRQLAERNPCYIQRTLNPFPPMWRGVLTYAFDDVLTCPGSGVNTWQIQAYGMNNLFDPQTSLGGHQPYQFDQLMGINGPYTSYCGMGFSYNVRFADPNADGVYVGVTYSAPGDVYGTPTGQGLAAMVEKGRMNYQTLSNSGSQECSFNGYIDLPSLIGVTADQYYAGGQALYAGTYNSSPPLRFDFYICACSPAGTQVGVRASGYFRYHAIFYNAVSSPQS